MIDGDNMIQGDPEVRLREKLLAQDIARHQRQIEKLKIQRNEINRKIAAEEKMIRELQGVKR